MGLLLRNGYQTTHIGISSIRSQEVVEQEESLSHITPHQPGLVGCARVIVRVPGIENRAAHLGQREGDLRDVVETVTSSGWFFFSLFFLDKQNMMQ